MKSVFLAALFIAGCAKSGVESPKSRPPPLVSVAPVGVRDVQVEVRAPVELRPIAQADVGSKTLGILDAVLVDRGDRVKRGQLVALVRPSDLPDQLSAARGNLSQAQASWTLARTNFERSTQLAPSGVVSQQELSNSSAALAQTEALRAAAQAQVAALAVRLGETRIEAPMDGVVSVRRLDPGALVGPPGGGAILTVVRVDTLRLFITVTERDLAVLHVGQEAHLSLDAFPGKQMVGKVVRLAPTLDPLTRTLDAEVQLPNPDGSLRPGMFGRGAIVVATHPRAPFVPASAVTLSSGEAYVFVLLSGNKVERRRIEVGVDEGTWLEVTSGLAPGEEIVIAGVDLLSSGSPVRVVRNIDPYTGTAKVDAPAPALSTGVP